MTSSVSSTASVEQFRSIFPEVSTERVKELIDAATGNVDRAIEFYLSQADPAPQPPPSKPKLTARARSIAAASAAVVSGTVVSRSSGSVDRDVTTIEDTDNEDIVMNQSLAVSLKRKAPPSQSPAASPAKRAKKGDKLKDDAKQNSLASFFNRSTGASPNKSVKSHCSSPSAPPVKATIPGLLDDWAPAAPSSSSSSSPLTRPSVPAAASSTTGPSLMSISDNISAAAGDASTDPLQPCFKPGEPVPFVFLSRIWNLIELENGRLKIINWLCYAFWQILAYTPEDLAAALSLSSDQLAPPYENHQLGVGGRMLYSLISEMTGVSHAKLSADHARLGDLGLIAAQYRLNQSLLFRPAPLQTRKVFQTFHSISEMNKREQKERVLKQMFTAAREAELTYLIRVAEGGLRIGAVITTVLTALAKAFTLHHLYTQNLPDSQKHQACTFERVVKATDAVRGAKLSLSTPFVLDPIPPSTAPAQLQAAVVKRLPSHLAQATARIRRAYAELPSFHAILPVLLKYPTAIYELDQHIRLTPGIPIKPQLGRPMTSILQVMKLFRGMPFTVEVKYDGLRAQIHRLPNGSYKIFSRHLMDQGDRWSDLEPHIEAAIKHPEAVKSFILDAEIVAIEWVKESASAAAASSSDSALTRKFNILPFQQLSTRKRGSGNGNGTASAAAASKPQRVEVTCMVYVFDFLSLNGESLLLKSLPQRRALMSETFRESPGEFQFVEHVDISAESTKDLSFEDLEEEEDTKRAAALVAKKGSKGEEDESSGDEADEEELKHDPDNVSKKPGKKLIDDASEEVIDLDHSCASAEESKSNQTEDVEMIDAAASSSSATSVAPSASDAISAFLNSTAIVRGEGVMAKSLSPHSTYEPDVRTDQWCKLKKDYIAGFGIADSIDVCIIGAWWGNGRKAGWMSPFLGAVYNPDTGEYESFCKIMSGFSDSVYKQFTAECQDLIIPHPLRGYRVTEGLIPSMWFKPVKVWEIRGADMTISPAHTAGIGIVHPSKGISLRFPRYIRSRDDKGPEQCTTSEEIAALYRGQHGVQSQQRRFPK